MFEQEERPGLTSQHATLQHEAGGFDDEEPPSKPRRHPLWRKVPKRQWDDWRWQSQNAIRSVRQLRDLLPFSDAELEPIGALEAEDNVAVPPYFFSLVDGNGP